MLLVAVVLRSGVKIMSMACFKETVEEDTHKETAPNQIKGTEYNSAAMPQIGCALWENYGVAQNPKHLNQGGSRLQIVVLSLF